MLSITASTAPGFFQFASPPNRVHDRIAQVGRSELVLRAIRARRPGRRDFRSALSRARFARRDPFQRGATATARAQAALDGAESQDGWTTGRLRSNVSFTQRRAYPDSRRPRPA